MTILCQVCGTANIEGTTYCEGCGVELSGAAVSPPTTAPLDGGMSSPAVDAAPEGGTTSPAAPLSADTTAPAALAAEADAPVEVGPTELASTVPASETPVSGVAVAAEASVASVSSPTLTTPPLTGEAKLGIKKFGASTGEFIPLQGERLVVGRFDASSGPVEIDLSALGGQEHISRRHAELYREQGVWSVRDLGSTNGVYIKRKGEPSFSPRLQEPALLADGDEVAFGNLMLIFHQS